MMKKMEVPLSFTNFSSKEANPDMPEVSDISAEEVRAKATEVKLIDVRSQDEYTGELGHIDGSTLITLDTLEDRLGELPKDQSIVFICRSGKRSAAASMIALQNGFESVFNMQGGMIQWNELGFETKK